MKEGQRGSSRQSPKKEFPEDTQTHYEGSDWKLYLSKKEQCLIIDTLHYHPGPLYLNKNDLEKIIKELEE